MLLKHEEGLECKLKNFNKTIYDVLLDDRDFLWKWNNSFLIDFTYLYISPDCRKLYKICVYCCKPRFNPFVGEIAENCNNLFDCLDLKESITFWTDGENQIYSKKQYNYMCKIISSMVSNCGFDSFKFECVSKFRKLINSMTSPSIIYFTSCDFDFEGDWKINQSTRYAWVFVSLNLCNFSQKTFKSVISTIGQVAEFGEFQFSIMESKITTEDTSFDSALTKLGIDSVRISTNQILITKFSCYSSKLQDADFKNLM